MKTFPFALAGAVALHAAAAASFAALGVPHGTGTKPSATGATIDIEAEPAAPVIPHDEPAPAAVTARVHGVPRAQHVQATASVAPIETATAATDVVPGPTASQAPPPAHFSMTVSSNPGGASGAGTTSAGAAPAVLADGDVSTRARQIGGSEPAYPAEAVAQGVELSAPLAFEIVVDPQGRVASARELGHAGYGFDEAASAALASYRFSPATRAGHPVWVRMRWTVDFKLE